MKVLLDNGHGENTPGKRSPKWSDGSQLFEWEYAREIAKGVYNQLRAKGIDAELLVKENIDVPLAERADALQSSFSSVVPVAEGSLSWLPMIW